MNEPVHKDQSAGRWFTLSLVEQLANVGSEAERAISWRDRGNVQQSERAFDRMLELLDLTIADPRWIKARRLKEITRLREVLCDLFLGDNAYQTSFEYVRQYFLEYGLAARLNR